MVARHRATPGTYLRTAAHDRRRRSRTHLLLAVALAALALPVVVLPHAEAAADWQLIAPVTFPFGANNTYNGTFWTDATDPESIALDPAPRFRLVLTAGPGGDAPTEGPAFRVEGWACPDEVCPAERPSDTGFLTLLVDADDGQTDASYVWEPERARTFESPGTWRLVITPDGAPPGSRDILTLTLVDENPADMPLGQRMQALVRAYETPVGKVVAFIGLLAAFYLLARVTGRISRRTFLSPKRIDPTIGRLTQRLFTAIIVLVGLAVSLWLIWGVNFWAGLTALGLLSVALGFGMQTTVANIMGGINLALDRPFVIGDRVQVGDTWGDVQEIGLRSTRILTTKHEVVIIPNKVLDEREIWNYTIQHPEMRLDIDVGISYDSDRRLAEAVMLQAAHRHDDILPYPRPRVLLQGFGDSSVDLQLRCWIPGAKDARPIASQVRKDIFDLFEEHGVSIPFPHRTLLQHQDLEPPKRATDEELDALAVHDPRLPRMVYATAGPEPIRPTADLVCHIASELDLSLVVLHVTKGGHIQHRRQASRVLTAFKDAAAHHGISIKTVERSGPVVDTICEALNEHDADLLAIGSSKHSLVSSAHQVAGLTRDIKEAVDVPVLIVPRNLRINDRTLAHYDKLVSERQKGKRKESGIEAGDDDAHTESAAEDISDGAQGGD